MKKTLLIVIVLLLPQAASATTVYLTSGTSWTVPSDWNNSNNTIEVVGGGGTGDIGVNYIGGGGAGAAGGGGAYSAITNLTLTPGSAISYRVGGTSGDSWFNSNSCTGSSVCAKGGASAANFGNGAAGGAAAGGVGTTKYSGGAGGNGDSVNSGGGGGGAAGASGNGINGSNTILGSDFAPGPGGAGNANTAGGGAGGVTGSQGSAGGIGGAGSNFGNGYGSGGGGAGGYGCCGAGGNGGNYGAGGGGGGAYMNGGIGAPGLIVITYTVPIIPPTCSVSLDQNPIPYGSGTTLRWSSANANTSFYINNVGYVTPNVSGFASVQPSASTDYTGTAVGPGGTVTCAASSGTPPGTLTVTPPASPTATITASSTSIYTGQSTGIHATFAAASGDLLTHDNIDSPVGTGLGATVNPDANKYITFTPSSAGTYTFFARAQTSYFTSWTTYAQTSVTVTDPPSCTPSTTYTCTNSTALASTTVTQTCQTSTTNTTCSYQCAAGACIAPPPPSFISGTTTSGHLQVAPSLVPSGGTTHVYWNVADVSSCSVTGTNADSWTGAASGTGGKTSAPITHQTTFTLSCTGLDNSSILETKSVNILPVFQEL